MNERNQQRRSHDEGYDDFDQRHHGRSEALRPQQCVGQVEQQAERNESGERIVEDHGVAPLQPFAGVGIADACNEEAEGERQHDNVQHGNVPVHRGPRTEWTVFAFCQAEVPPGA